MQLSTACVSAKWDYIKISTKLSTNVAQLSPHSLRYCNAQYFLSKPKCEASVTQEVSSSNVTSRDYRKSVIFKQRPVKLLATSNGHILRSALFIVRD